MLTAGTCVAQCCGERERSKARALFIDVERVARLTETEQGREIPRLYGEVWPVLEKEMLGAMAYRVLPGESASEGSRATPQELAAEYDRAGGWPLVAEAARTRCRTLLSAHRQKVEPLVIADLQSGAEDRVWRGLRAVGEFRLTSLFTAVARHLEGPQEAYAAQALRDLNDPRAIPLLVERGVLRHFEALRHLQRGRPAYAVLVTLLEDKDGEVRWRAGYAIAESRDPALVPVVQRLARDETPKVRAEAADIGFNLPPPAFALARPALVKLLSDPEIAVRSSIAVLFASRNDKVGARAIYDLLAHEDVLEGWRQSNVVQAMQTLTGSYFGFTPGTISTPEVRRAALERLAAWITDNGERQ